MFIKLAVPSTPSGCSRSGRRPSRRRACTATPDLPTLTQTLEELKRELTETVALQAAAGPDRSEGNLRLDRTHGRVARGSRTLDGRVEGTTPSREGHLCRNRCRPPSPVKWPGTSSGSARPCRGPSRTPCRGRRGRRGRPHRRRRAPSPSSVGISAKSYLGPYTSHIRCRSSQSRHCAPRPSTITTSSPSSRLTLMAGRAGRLTRATEPVLNHRPSDSHTAHTGRQCARPSTRMVATQ